jgi:hypothetical protein
MSRPTYSTVILLWRKFICDKSASGLLINPPIVFTFMHQRWCSTVEMGNIEQVFNVKVKLKILKRCFIVNGLRYKTCMKIGPNACKTKNIGL